MKDQRVGPGGLPPIPTPPSGEARGLGGSMGWDGDNKHYTRAGPLSGAPSMPVCPRGRLAPLKWVRREPRAPINKKHGSGIVFPPFHKPPSALMCEFWCGLLEALLVMLLCHITSVTLNKPPLALSRPTAA